MPQELQVLTCFQCETFQVHIVKKVPKWQCKMCGEKQSIKKVYFVGSGKECREIVQNLNTKRIQIEEKQSITHRLSDEDHLDITYEIKYKNEGIPSKWNTLLPESKDVDDISEPEQLQKYTFERKTTKRKKTSKNKQAHCPEDSNKKMIYNKHRPEQTVTNYREQDSSDEENYFDSPYKSENQKISRNNYENVKPTTSKLSKWDEECTSESDSTSDVSAKEQKKYIVNLANNGFEENTNKTLLSTSEVKEFPTKTINVLGEFRNRKVNNDMHMLRQNCNENKNIQCEYKDQSFKTVGSIPLVPTYNGNVTKSINIFEDDEDLDLGI